MMIFKSLLIFIFIFSINGHEPCIGTNGVHYLVSYPTFWKNGLSFCEKFHRKSCCAPRQTDMLQRKYNGFISSGISERCAHKLEEQLCYPCDPRVGTRQVNKICKSWCLDWYEACKDDFFSAKTISGDSIEPCMDDSLVCSQLHAIVTTGVDLCLRFGFAIDESQCYDATADETAIGIAEQIKSSFEEPEPTDTVGALYQQFLHSVNENKNEIALSLIIGLLLIAFLLHQHQANANRISVSKRLLMQRAAEARARET